jgi:hypothetical protein
LLLVLLKSSAVLVSTIAAVAFRVMCISVVTYVVALPSATTGIRRSAIACLAVVALESDTVPSASSIETSRGVSTMKTCFFTPKKATKLHTLKKRKTKKRGCSLLLLLVNARGTRLSWECSIVAPGGAGKGKPRMFCFW